MSYNQEPLGFGTSSAVDDSKNYQAQVECMVCGTKRLIGVGDCKVEFQEFCLSCGSDDYK